MILLILILNLFLFSQSSFAQTSEFISNFHSDITINQDTSITIKENIDYYTPIEKHGIFRTIPYRYQQDNSSFTRNIKNISITADNKSIPFIISKEEGNLILKIGDPNITFQGPKKYQITYTTENALTKFQDRQELFWDITGEFWKFPISSSSATIHSPFAEIQKIDCFSGLVGTNDFLCTSTQKNINTAQFEYKLPISTGSNFTVSILLNPSNQIIFPSTTQKNIKKIIDNLYIFYTLIPLIIIFIFWYKFGRDYIFLSPNVFNLDPKRPQKLRPLLYSSRIPFVYEPLKLTPGEAGTALDEKVDNQDVVAEIIDLARLKYLSIKIIPKKGIFSKDDYQFIQLKKSDDLLPKHQKYLLDNIFNNKETILLSDLKNHFYTHFEETKKLIYQSVQDKKLFTKNPQSTRITSIIIFIIVNIVLFPLSIYNVTETGLPYPIFLFFIQFILSIPFVFNLVQKTATGTNLMLQAKGLQKTINLGKWREEVKEKNLFIEEILPFAISLGVIKKLSNDMKQLNLNPPNYLQAYALSNIASSNSNFSNFVNSFSSDVSSTLSYHQSSSSGSFGGGFSGGGGGGGGGGSW